MRRMKARNPRIQARTLHDVTSYFGASEDTLDARIQELESQWNLERTLEANGAALALIGLALGISADRRFFALTLLASGCLLQHALTGWTPPLPMLRRLGIRSSTEIQQ